MAVLYLVLWVCAICLWAVFVSFVAAAVGGAISAAIFAVDGFVMSGIALIGLGLVLLGLSVFVFFGALAVSRATAKLPAVFFRRRYRYF